MQEIYDCGRGNQLYTISYERCVVYVESIGFWYLMYLCKTDAIANLIALSVKWFYMDDHLNLWYFTCLDLSEFKNSFEGTIFRV